MCKYRKIRGANVVQNPKEKSQTVENQGFAILLVPGAEALLLWYFEVQLRLTA